MTTSVEEMVAKLRHHVHATSATLYPAEAELYRWAYNTLCGLTAENERLRKVLDRLLDYALFHDSSLTDESPLVVDCRAALQPSDTGNHP